jgi:hypothetical protein
MKTTIFLFLSISLLRLQAQSTDGKLPVIMDMVHHNPGEAFTQSMFNSPATLRSYQFNAQVINEFQSVHCAVTYQSLNEDIFPAASPERAWADALAQRITAKIADIHRQGLEACYFTDIIVLPRRLVEIYRAEICDSAGTIDFSRPMTQEIHRIMIREIFERFPELDGLVIRVGETYLHNLPYHTGNGPVKKNSSGDKTATYRTDNGETIHRDLINLLRDEVCVKRNRKIFYRTWDFGYFHTVPEYYLNVTDYVPTHPNLYFCIKHVKGDYQRTYPFNPTLGAGKHKQIVEVQCQREYEGKGAYPNYIADGVLNGFEELKNDSAIHSLNQLKENPLFSGIWTWSRGGGWTGPYIQNELWCELNAYVLSHWANNTKRAEEDIFGEFAAAKGITGIDAGNFHRLALLSADAIVRGRASLTGKVNVWWTRDEFVSGQEALDIKGFIGNNLTDKLLAEKHESVNIWMEMQKIAASLKGSDKAVLHYIRTSTDYGFLLYSIYEQGFIIMLKGAEGDLSGKYDIKTIRAAIEKYDSLWNAFEQLKKDNPDCASLYRPYSFDGKNPPFYYGEKGLNQSINKYRNLK